METEGEGRMVMALDVQDWAQQQFADCQLGDKRRVKRMVKLATEVASKPDASTPKQTENWGDCKAAYRLFECPQVTFDAVTAPHFVATRQAARGVCLILNDTTEINYGKNRQIKGIGRVGSSKSCGFYLHSALVVDEAGDMFGLGAQELYKRPLKKVKRVSSANRKKLARETDVWGRVIDRVGPPSGGATYIHVCDRGADNFDVYCHLLQQQCGWVIRAAQLKRKVRDVHHQVMNLDAAITAAPVLGTYELRVQANGKQAARTAKLEARAAYITMPRPRTGASDYVLATGIKDISMWVVEVRETQTTNTTPLRWVLLTHDRVETFDDAWRVVERYERRPLIEEYHKCLKTGCGVEEREYQHADRLEAVIGLLSIVSVRLLYMKTISRQNPDQLAAGVVPSEWLTTLPLILKRPRPVLTVRQFMHSLASLGGFLCRKSDGEPGWQTLWHGLTTLLAAIRTRRALERSG